MSSEPTTPPADASTNQPRPQNSGQRRAPKNNPPTSNPSNYEGECTDLGVILALRIERMSKKVPFHQFIEKVYFYIVTNFKDGGDLYPLFHGLSDPINTLLKKHKPTKPIKKEEGEPMDDVDMEIYKEEIKQFVQRKMNLRRNMEKTYGLVWGQCSTALQSFIKGISDFEQRSATFDIIWLLTELKKATSGIDNKANAWVNMHDALAILYKMKQGPSESNDHYLERFKSNITAVELTHGSQVFYSPGLTGTTLANATPEEVNTEEERSKAILLLKNADDHRYQALSKKLKENTFLDRDEYPVTISDMYELMVKTSANQQSIKKTNNNNRHGVVLAQQCSPASEDNNTTRTLIPGTDGRTFNVLCYRCNKWGHYASSCNEPDTRVGFSSLQHGFILAQSEQAPTSIIPKDWILLDSCSTDCVFNDHSLLSNISPCSQQDKLKIYTNGGSLTYDHIGVFKYLPLTSYYNPDSIANILSLKDVLALDHCQVSIDQGPRPAFVLTFDGRTIRFESCGGGLFHCLASDFINKPVQHKSTKTVTFQLPQNHQSITLLSTSSDREALFSNKEISRAKAARLLQEEMCWPSDDSFKAYLSQGYITHCPITPHDVDRANHLYGVAPSLAQGKMVAPSQVANSASQVPLNELSFAGSTKIKLYVDIFYVNGLCFLHTKSKDINFITIHHLHNRKHSRLLKLLKHVIAKYITRGFTITDIFADNEFDHDDFHHLALPANLHICAQNEHVPIIERSIRTVKERARAICQGLPYLHFPKLMTISLLESIERWLNILPTFKNSTITQSPALLIEGRSAPSFSRPRLPFGAYAMAYTGTDNTMEPRATPSIALRESNDSNGFFFMSLETGKRLHCNKWTQLVVTDDIIEAVHDLCHDDPVTPPDEPGFTLLDSSDPFEPDISAQDQHDSATTTPSSPPSALDTEVISTHLSSIPDDNSSIHSYDYSQHHEAPFIDDSIQDSNLTHDLSPIQDQTHDSSPTHELNQDSIQESTQEPIQDSIQDSVSSHDQTRDSNHDCNTTSPSLIDMPAVLPQAHFTNIDSADFTYNMANQYDTSDLDTTIENLRNKHQRTTNQGTSSSSSSNESSSSNDDSSSLPSLPHSLNDDASYQLVQTKPHPFTTHEGFTTSIKHIFTQMSATKGIAKHGEKAIASIFKELKQLNDGVMEGKPVIQPIDFEKLSDIDKSTALEAVNLIKEKRCGKIKARTCANGSKQRRFINKDDNFSSPTASLESILMTLLIDAWEERDVAVADIPGAYLHAEFPTDKRVILKLKGVFVDIMTDVNPEFKHHVVYERDKKGREIKCLYVRVLRALYGCLESALLWYELYSTTLKDMGFVLNPYDRCVANKVINGSQCTIVFYVDDNKISHKDPHVVTKILQDISEHFGELTISRGNKHDFLGMNIEIKDKKVYIDMKEQVEQSIEWGKERGNTKPPTPAASSLFLTDEGAPALSEEASDVFHSIVQKLLYICKRARPDIEPAISYLCTRVSNPNTVDDVKLTRVLRYLQDTINDRRVIGIDDINTLKTWVDAAYAVHSDMRSHTGGTMSFGTGVIHTKSSKQKLNTKSSTEAELVGVSEYLPYHIWLVNFLEYQGYDIKNKILYQDNQSAIKMEKNGRNSCTGNSRHIDIRFFFVKDRVDSGDINVEYCPTNKMLADFFTKPLQGTVFKNFRSTVMGHSSLA